MGIIRNVLNQQIQSNNLLQSNDATATILDYNSITNVATIEYQNPNGEGTLYRENVPVSNTLGGVTGAGIQPGQLCTITFSKNNILSPMITGVIGSNYAAKTCSDQGAYIVDYDIMSASEEDLLGPDVIIAMTNDWLEEDNDDATKYNNELGNYTDVDATEEAHNLLTTIDKYKQNEQGITNLDTKSTVKFKENGDIDLFVDNNVGIRICKKSQKIMFFGMGVNIGGTELGPEVLNALSNAKIDEDGNIILNTGGNGPNVSDIIKVSKIGDIIKELDDNIGEIEEAIQLLIQITGNSSAFDNLLAKIQEYKTLKEEYYNADDSITTDEINDLYDKLVALKELFDSELEQGRQTLSLLEE